ncbi:MAG: hypothetical protein QOC68_1163 [Solirubrobacteraceae bacterium]|jgi:uncharacterized RDD family membrane protein YckC|nr:hypothetical protein [Solirubrobacteraceae bacterium]
MQASSGGSEVVGRRIGAGLLDVLVLGVVFVVLALLIGDSQSSGSSAGVRLGGGGTLVFLALTLLYYFGQEARDGRTLGKRALGIRVVRAADGGQPSTGEVAVRTVLRLVDALPFLYLVGVITILVTGSRAQRLGDLAAGTTVVRA